MVALIKMPMPKPTYRCVTKTLGNGRITNIVCNETGKVFATICWNGQAIHHN